MDEKLFSYYTATAAVIGSMLMQVALIIWGDATLTTFIIGETILAGCLVYLRADYNKNYKKNVDKSDSIEL